MFHRRGELRLIAGKVAVKRRGKKHTKEFIYYARVRGLVDTVTELTSSHPRGGQTETDRQGTRHT